MMFSRENTRPHVFDWNRDGNVDLVLGYRNIRVERNLHKFDLAAWLKAVAEEERAGVEHKKDVPNYLRAFDVDIPQFAPLNHRPSTTGSVVEGRRDDFQIWRGTRPFYMHFDDWDGDGNVDLLALIYSHFSFRRVKAKTSVKKKERTGLSNPEKPQS